MARYRKFHSKYSLEKKHEVLTNGDTIWEKDWSTVRGPIIGNFGTNSKRKYTDGNFTFITTNIPSPEKKHTIAKEGKVYTYDEVKDAVREETVNSKQPSYTSDDLRTYAYFGSAYELVKNSIEEIVAKFPPKLYTNHDNLPITPLIGDTEHDIENAVNKKKQPYYILNNPFNVDFITQSPTISEGSNPMQYMSVSYPLYKVVTYKDGKPDCEYAIDSYEIELVGDKINCVNETYTLYFHLPNGEVQTISETVVSQNDYEQIESGALKKYITAPTVNNLEYWVKADKKDDTTHDKNDKYGDGFKKIELYTNNGTHFYPIIFQPITYAIYFMKADGSLSSKTAYTVKSRDELNRLESGADIRTATPSLKLNVLYWVKGDKKDADPSTLTDADKYGDGYNAFNLYVDNGETFYPVMFQAVTYKVYFHDANGTLKNTASSTISSYSDYQQIVNGTKTLPLQSSDIPSVDNLVFWVLEDKRTATSFNDSDKHTTFDFVEDNNIHYYVYTFNPITYTAEIWLNSDNKLLGTTITIDKYADYEKVLAGTYTPRYLDIDSVASKIPNTVMYFTPASKVNDKNLSDTDKYGFKYQKIDILKYPNQVGKFYAVEFEAVTYKVYLCDTDGNANTDWTQSYTVTTESEYKQIVAGTKKLIATNLPNIDDLMYWVKADKKDVDKSEHKDSDKYGDGFNDINLVDDNNIYFHPITAETITVIPMDDLLNSSSINIIGFTDESYFDGEVSYAPFTDSPTAFATWSPDVDEFNVGQYVLDFENTKATEDTVYLYKRSITDDAPSPTADYSTPFWNSKTDYDTNTSPAGYINYTKTNTTKKVFSCFWIVSYQLAYPHKHMGNVWNDMTSAGFKTNNVSSNFSTSDKTYYDKYIQLEHCPKCSLFTTTTTTHPIYLEALLKSKLSPNFLPTGEPKNGIFHWHQTVLYNENEAYHSVIGAGFGVYDCCYDESFRPDLINGLLTLFVHEQDITTIQDATTANGQKILKRINSKRKDSNSTWYICIVTPNYDNPEVQTYMDNFTNGTNKYTRNLSYSNTKNVYTFQIKVGDDTYNYTCDKATLDTFGTITNGVFKITKPTNIPVAATHKITTDDTYIPKADVGVNNPRKFTKYTNINIIQYSGIEFVKLE